jgi:hypothetical protein
MRRPKLIALVLPPVVLALPAAAEAQNAVEPLPDPVAHVVPAPPAPAPDPAPVAPSPPAPAATSTPVAAPKGAAAPATPASTPTTSRAPVAHAAAAGAAQRGITEAGPPSRVAQKPSGQPTTSSPATSPTQTALSDQQQVVAAADGSAGDPSPATLPFTGLDVFLVVLAGAGALGGGLLLRRSAARR